MKEHIWNEKNISKYEKVCPNFWLVLYIYIYMGHSTELVQSQVGNILKICMFYSQNFVRIYIVPYLQYTYLVNEPSIFILYFQNVLECFSSPKNCHYRNIVINYSKNVLLLTCSDCVSFPSLKSIFTNISWRFSQWNQ